MDRTLAERCKPIELLIVDVDGVLTAGGIQYSSQGGELKTFHVRDGSGFKFWNEAGKRAAIITGRSSPTIEVRAAELKIDPVVQGAADKLAAFHDVLKATQLLPEQVTYVGDDLPDLPVLRRVGLAVAVGDACVEVRADAHFVTRAVGGHGAARETIELVLRSQGAWQRIVEKLRAERT